MSKNKRGRDKIQGSFHALVYRDFFSDDYVKLRPTSRLVYQAICLKAGKINKDRAKPGSKVQISYGELAKELNVNIKTVIAALKQLMQAGWIDREVGDWKDGPFNNGPYRWTIRK